MRSAMSSNEMRDPGFAVTASPPVLLRVGPEELPLLLGEALLALRADLAEEVVDSPGDLIGRGERVGHRSRGPRRGHEPRGASAPPHGQDAPEAIPPQVEIPVEESHDRAREVSEVRDAAPASGQEREEVPRD